MANGTIHKEIARADRIRERQDQDRRASRNASQNLREAISAMRQPGTEPYREEMESNSEITVGLGERVKVGAKGIPPKALGATLVVLAVGGVVVALVKLFLSK